MVEREIERVRGVVLKGERVEEWVEVRLSKELKDQYQREETGRNSNCILMRQFYNDCATLKSGIMI